MSFNKYIIALEDFNHALNPNHKCDWAVSTTTTTVDTSDREIWYTTTDNQIFDMKAIFDGVDTSVATVKNPIVSNTYDGTKWIILFENPVTAIGLNDNEVYPVFKDINNIGMTTIQTITLPSVLTNIYDYTFVSNSNLSTINYKGTTSQWNAITKVNDWDYGTSGINVICTDGTINLN